MLGNETLIGRRRRQNYRPGNKTIEIIEKVRQTGGAATMAILGQTVLSNVKPPGLFKYKTYELTISQDKAKV